VIKINATSQTELILMATDTAPHHAYDATHVALAQNHSGPHGDRGLSICVFPISAKIGQSDKVALACDALSEAGLPAAGAQDPWATKTGHIISRIFGSKSIGRKAAAHLLLWHGAAGNAATLSMAGDAHALYLAQSKVASFGQRNPEYANAFLAKAAHSAAALLAPSSFEWGSAAFESHARLVLSRWAHCALVASDGHAMKSAAGMLLCEIRRQSPLLADEPWPMSAPKALSLAQWIGDSLAQSSLDQRRGASSQTPLKLKHSQLGDQAELACLSAAQFLGVELPVIQNTPRQELTINESAFKPISSANGSHDPFVKGWGDFGLASALLLNRSDGGLFGTKARLGALDALSKHAQSCPMDPLLAWTAQKDIPACISWLDTLCEEVATRSGPKCASAASKALNHYWGGAGDWAIRAMSGEKTRAAIDQWKSLVQGKVDHAGETEKSLAKAMMSRASDIVYARAALMRASGQTLDFSDSGPSWVFSLKCAHQEPDFERACAIELCSKLSSLSPLGHGLYALSPETAQALSAGLSLGLRGFADPETLPRLVSSYAPDSLGLLFPTSSTASMTAVDARPATVLGNFSERAQASASKMLAPSKHSTLARLV
jgi:hypothetical protein